MREYLHHHLLLFGCQHLLLKFTKTRGKHTLPSRGFRINRRVRIVMDSDMLAVVVMLWVERWKIGWLTQMRRHSNLFDAGGGSCCRL